MTQFFRSVHRGKKLSHSDPKSWVTAGTKIWPNFLGQNDSIFHSMHREKYLSHFDQKSWVTGGTKIWPNFLSQTDPIFSLSAPRKRIQLFWP